MQKARMDESQAGIKIVRRHTNNLRCADETTLMAESQEELKSLLMRMKEESERSNFDLLSSTKSQVVSFLPLKQRESLWQYQAKPEE